MKKDFEIKCNQGILRVQLEFVPNEDLVKRGEKMDFEPDEVMENCVIKVNGNTGEIKIEGDMLEDIEVNEIDENGVKNKLEVEKAAK